MDAPQTDQSGPAETAAAKQRKTAREIVFTTTPVVLTILGTVLAGLSSSEMTLAQYYRTLAAQSQSKAANQWNFFQVKRIRGTSLEVFLDLLPVQARAAKLDAPSLLAAADTHLRQARLSQGAAARLQQASDAAKGELPAKSGPATLQAAARVAQLANDQLQAAEKAHALLAQRARTPEVQAAFQAITHREMPAGATVAPIENAVIAREIGAMSNGQDEAQVLTQLGPGEINAEIQRAESNTRNVELALEAPDRLIDELGRAIRDQLALTVVFHQAVQEVVGVVEELPANERQPLVALQRAAVDVQQRDTALLQAGDELKNLYKAADHGYTARRYRWEADFNRQTAQLYELQVRKHSQDAERHRQRSRLFFFGLLFAQAGTAIASLALAARQQSILWAIAGLAGLAALIFSAVVYLAV